MPGPLGVPAAQTTIFLAWPEPAQPDHACYQQKRETPTKLTRTGPPGALNARPGTGVWQFAGRIRPRVRFRDDPGSGLARDEGHVLGDHMAAEYSRFGRERDLA